MSQIINSKLKIYNLEDRTLAFAKQTNVYVNVLPKTIANIEIAKQLIRASGSVGANYIEANESISKKDFIYRIKISKKEAKESRFWLLLSEPTNQQLTEKIKLINEATELTKIFGSIIEKVKKRFRF